MTKKTFIHLHVHSEYSLLDGAIMITDLLNKAKDLGMSAVALTDHGVMYGAVEFYSKAKAMGIKPIVGCEVYLAPRTRLDKDAKMDKSPAHLTLLVKNLTGYKNLLKLVSIAHLEGFFYKPRIDYETLSKYHEGLVCLSGCISGPVVRSLLVSNLEQAQKEIQYFKDLFGEDFYLEMQDHGLDEQKLVNKKLADLSKATKTPLVITNDAHYLNKEDAIIQDILLALQTGKTLKDNERLHFKTNEFYFKSQEEMYAEFKDLPEALAVTGEIADKCNLELTLGEHFLPLFTVPDKETPDSYLEKLAWEGLQNRYKTLTDAIKERFYFELSVIKKMGFASYFLIVSDLIHFAKNSGISVGPGRGSAAGSIIAYSLGITNINPLKFNLLFERFLNPDRISLPDIDIDFCIENRQRVIDYTKQKYGTDHVAQIITFGRMAARMAIRDVGRVLEVPLSEVDKVAKLVPFGLTIKEALEQSSELKQIYNAKTNIKELLDVACKLEGIARHTGIHAAGVVISKDPLMETVPMIEKDEQLVTMFPKDDLESVGLLKMDFLGLRNLTMIAKTIALIKQSQGKEIDIENIHMDDPDTYKTLSSGNSMGIFQLESQGMQILLKSLLPTVFEDIIALLALYRPGPLGSGMDKDFVNRKHGRQKVTYPIKELETILKDTYGTILYQEQVMQIASAVGGFSMSEADTLRKAMGKKKKEEMDKMQQKFINGAVAQGIAENKANSIFEMMAKFAEYGFNKSHSAAYAFITYQTAYLKTHYPIEFMAALISSNINDTDKVSLYIAEAKNLGIDVLPPDINESYNDFFIINNKILFGLQAIKNVGSNAIESIVNTRVKDGIFHSLIDFCIRVDLRLVNKRVIESLIKAGAFDVLGKRKGLLDILDDTVNEALKIQKVNENGQLNMFSTEEIHTIERDKNLKNEEFSQRELLKLEKEMLGVYVSGHPLQDYIEHIKSNHFKEIQNITEENSKIKMIGLLTSFKKRITKNKQTMLTGTVEDLTGTLPFVIFPDKYEQLADSLYEDRPYLISGIADSRNDQMQIIIDNVDDQFVQRVMPVKIFINIEQEQIDGVKTLLQQYTGNTPVYLEMDGYQILLNKKYWFNLRHLEELNLAFGNDSVKIMN
ncbi:MAG: DNA polymerase III subunit alpha [Candidatus Margulisbacteria bacterium]|nr:DNA polymerase III subunit alpha [Candidatus Margulisiibacteriota bacterium]